jgi:ABC-type transporter Mla subunit MlaD
VNAIEVGGKQEAELTLEVDPRYLALIPENVRATISATTLFGDKHVSLIAPKHPSLQRISSSDLIDVTSVTTEFDTLFEAVVDLARQVDPIKLNQTLSATAQALDGLGERFGQSIVNGNQILADINPRIPQVDRDNRLLADLADVYATSAPNLLNGLQNAATTADTFSEQQGDIDSALMAAIGFGDTGGDIFDRGGAPTWCGLQETSLPPLSFLTRTVQICFAPSATSTTSNPESPQIPGKTATPPSPTPKSSGRATPTSTRTTCRGPTRAVARRAGRAVGSPSPVTCGRRRTS